MAVIQELQNCLRKICFFKILYDNGTIAAFIAIQLFLNTTRVEYLVFLL